MLIKVKRNSVVHIIDVTKLKDLPNVASVVPGISVTIL